MKLSELVKKIQKLDIENADSLSQEVTDYFNELTTENDKKISSLNTQIESLTTAMGIDNGTSEERLIAAKTTISTLVSERDELKTQNGELQNRITQNEKQTLINSAAKKAGASPEVLLTLISDEKVEIQGEEVTVNGEKLKDWATANKGPFLPALFPETTTSKKLPSSPPHVVTEKSNGEEKKQEEETDAIENHFAKTYRKPEFAI